MLKSGLEQIVVQDDPKEAGIGACVLRTLRGQPRPRQFREDNTHNTQAWADGEPMGSEDNEITHLFSVWSLDFPSLVI